MKRRLTGEVKTRERRTMGERSVRKMKRKDIKDVLVSKADKSTR